MNYGRFFEFDFESSIIEKGVAVFNYRWLEQKRPDDGKKTPLHPIYLVFTQDSIKFNLHYLENKNYGDAEKKDSVWRHYHNTIIEFRLSSNLDVSDGLTDVLNDTYRALFPVSVNTQLRKDIEVSFDSQDCWEKGFNGFACFEPEGKDVYGDNVNVNNHFLRKIILDFLYDLEFTDVFMNVPFYDRLSVKLKENFLFNALMNKTRYYYYRTVLSNMEVIEPCLNDRDENWDNMEKTERKIRSFIELYAKSEQDWVNSILDKRAMLQFHESPWFEESNEELEQVYWTRRENKWITKQNNGPGEEKRVEEIGEIPIFVNNSRVSRARKRILHRIGADKDSFRLTVDDAIRLANKRASNQGKADSLKYAENVHENITNESAKWEVFHYHFGGLIKIWCGNISTLLCSLALLIPVILVVATWLWGMLICIKPDEGSFVFFLVLLCCMFLGMKLFMHKFVRPTWGCGAWGLLMPRLLAAIVAAWFTMSMTNVLFKNFAFVTQSTFRWSAILILFLTTLLFVSYESRQFNPYGNLLSNIISSLALIFIAYFYAVVVGFMVYDFFGMRLFYNEIALDSCLYLPSKLMLKLRMEFVLQFSFFATFIGIFLQLMFKGRPVTDSNN